MGTAAVCFEGVWKKFRRGEIHNSLRDLLPAAGRRLFRRTRPTELEGPNDFWAVRDASFEVHSGEALGIIGANGAGKSTTLKLLTRILKPTRGHCAVRGRTGALIEVAAGFHPDLTGRENIFLQGAIMGMKRREIQQKLDAIVEFAGVEEFLDTPIKRYSSGMNARLGFSIAAHMDPDVLLIDEVLAVGDLAFQERCYDRMRQFKAGGAAIVFVSHNLNAVGAICDNVALLDHGRLVTIGRPADVFAAYVRNGRDAPAVGQSTLDVLTTGGEAAPGRIAAGMPLLVRAVIRPPATPSPLAFSLRIQRMELGTYVYLTTTPSLGCAPVRVSPGDSVEVRWRLHANLARGHYIFEVLTYELPHRRQLLVISTAPLPVDENESEQGTAYVSSSCQVAVSVPAEEVVSAGSRPRH